MFRCLACVLVVVATWAAEPLGVNAYKAWRTADGVLVQWGLRQWPQDLDACLLQENKGRK